MYSHLLNQATVSSSSERERQTRSPSICVVFVNIKYFSILEDDFVWGGCSRCDVKGRAGTREYSRRGACGFVTT